MVRYGTAGAVLMIDLDNFKDVNGTFGHKAGDDLLRGVAGALRNRIRQTDVLARVGGDEFAVLLPQTDADQAQVVADGIVKTFSRRVAVLGGQSIRMTTSTETAAIANIEEAKAFAHRMRERGCQFALDDFGACFGSFYSLKNLLPDFDGGASRVKTSTTVSARNRPP